MDKRQLVTLTADHHHHGEDGERTYCAGQHLLPADVLAAARDKGILLEPKPAGVRAAKPASAAPSAKAPRAKGGLFSRKRKGGAK